MAKRPKRRALIQGRKLMGKKQVSLVGNNLFVYRGKIYEINKFPAKATIYLDKTEVAPVALVVSSPAPKKKKKRKHKKGKRCHKATLYSNVTECPDVQILIENQV